MRYALYNLLKSEVTELVQDNGGGFLSVVA
jgi:hypothetical protein